MEMELISRETIKPARPTPPQFRNYPLCIIDHMVFSNYIPVLFFYPANDHSKKPQTSKISTLKKSLSRVLSRYYLFAGRLKDQLSVECNDQGVSFLVTRFTSNLSSILRNPSQESFNPLFPDQLQWKPMETTSTIVAIQINCFACGGIVIGICMCHKVGDAATFSNFVNDWAAFNRQIEKQEQEQKQEQENLLSSLPFPVPGASFFPQENLPIPPEASFITNETVCRRFVFEAAKINSLKAMVSSRNVPNPTRVEVVSGLIYKRAVSSLGLSFKTTTFRTAVNLRKRMIPPLPQKSVGNLVWFLFVSNAQEEMELHELVLKLKQGLSEFCDSYAKKFGGKNKDSLFIYECLEQAAASPDPRRSDAESDHSLLCCASWCRFPMYEADFGWGRPVWITTSDCPVKNSIVLIDTRDGEGIEALVSMEEHDMVKFEKDVELLQYASLNPSVPHGSIC